MRHARECDNIASAGSGAITAFAQGSTYTPHKHRMKIALWVAHRNRPFSIVEDSELLDIFYDLNSKVVTPSLYTVSRDVKEIFQMSRVKVVEILKVCTCLCVAIMIMCLIMVKAYPGKLHLCADGWTSPNVIAFIGITVHWVSEGQIMSLILDFVKYAKPVVLCQHVSHV
jgi:hypothetical protein